jgi:hypothetical protein
MKKLLAAGAFCAAAAVATQSHATTYFLTASDNFGTGNYGWVNVTDSGADSLKYVVTLASNFNFVDTGSHEAFAFSLKGNPTISIPSANPLPSGLSLLTHLDNVADAPFGKFDYAITCPSTCAPSNPGYTGGTTPSSLTFYITAPGLTDSWVDVATKQYGDHDIYFAADIIKTKDCSNNCTGAVGAFTFSDAVPEPATWAMMITGVFGVGAALRRRRQGAVQPLSA